MRAVGGLPACAALLLHIRGMTSLMGRRGPDGAGFTADRESDWATWRGIRLSSPMLLPNGAV